MLRPLLTQAGNSFAVSTRCTRYQQARLSLSEVESPALPQIFHNQTREGRRFTALVTLWLLAEMFVPKEGWASCMIGVVKW
jgi:hypothetical protein